MDARVSPRIAQRTTVARPTPAAGPANNRSRITNGRELLPGVDGRSLWARRFRDLVAEHAADLGGAASITQAQLSLIRRASALTVELERMETRFAVSDDGASVEELGEHQRATNTLRRVLAVLAEGRKTKPTTPDDPTARIVRAIKERRNVA